MKVAARNAFLIFGYSLRSGRIGRIVCLTKTLTDAGGQRRPNRGARSPARVRCSDLVRPLLSEDVMRVNKQVKQLQEPG